MATAKDPLTARLTAGGRSQSTKAKTLNKDHERASEPTQQRTIEIFEDQYDIGKLALNHWNLHIAKSVATDKTSALFNVIWQSKHLAPRTEISWENIYALNWTTTVPAQGVSVSLHGSWQPCGLGDAYELLDTGYWGESGDADAGYMCVSKVKYSYPSSSGIHIVIGVKNGGGGFDVIYIDPTALPLQSKARYQPQETVRWWYETEVRTATMITDAVTRYGSADMSQPSPKTKEFYYSSTYTYDDGQWSVSQDRPLKRYFSPSNDHTIVGPEADQVHLGSWIRKIIFGIALGRDAQGKVRIRLKQDLSVQFKDVNAKWNNDSELEVEGKLLKRAKLHTAEAIAVSTSYVTACIEDSLSNQKAENMLPDNETWQVRE
ncbi:hypothetical protein BDV19DRAFT_388540 [Aspergillus venezuelensis]